MPTWYEFSNANGLFTIEWSGASRSDTRPSWAVRQKEKNLASGRDAETSLAALVESGLAKELRLPARLIDWHMKRR